MMPKFLYRWFKKYIHNLLRSEIYDLPHAILRNCVCLDGALSKSRAKQELRHLVRTISLLVMVPSLFLLIHIGALWFFHSYIVPIPFVIELCGVFHWNEEQREANIEKEMATKGEMAQRYESWSKTRGYSPAAARLMEKTLWHGWPIYVFIGLFLVASMYLFATKFCLVRLQRYRKQVFSRQEAYFLYDLDHIPRDKIIY
jgi:hypothetical protein